MRRASEPRLSADQHIKDIADPRPSDVDPQISAEAPKDTSDLGDQQEQELTSSDAVVSQVLSNLKEQPNMSVCENPIEKLLSSDTEEDQETEEATKMLASDNKDNKVAGSPFEASDDGVLESSRPDSRLLEGQQSST